MQSGARVRFLRSAKCAKSARTLRASAGRMGANCGDGGKQQVLGRAGVLDDRHDMGPGRGQCPVAGRYDGLEVDLRVGAFQGLQICSSKPRTQRIENTAVSIQSLSPLAYAALIASGGNRSAHRCFQNFAGRKLLGSGLGPK